MSNIRGKKKSSKQFKLQIQINPDKAFYCLLTEYIRSSVSLLEICLFQGKIGSTDQHMLQKLIYFFLVWLFACAERIFYSRGQQRPEDIKTHQIRNTTSFLTASYSYGKSYRHRSSADMHRAYPTAKIH